MGLFDSVSEFFGAEDPSVQQASLLTAEQNKVLNEFLLPLLQQGVSNIPQGVFPGVPSQQDLTVQAPGLLGGQQASLAGLEQIALGVGQGQGGDLGLLRTAANTAQNFLQPEFDTQGFEDFFESSIRGPALKAFQERALPQLRRSTSENFFGTDALKQEQRLSEDFQKALLSEQGRLGFATRESGLNRAAQVLGLTPALAGAPGDILGQQSNILTQILGAGEIGRTAIGEQSQQDVAGLLRLLGVSDNRIRTLLGAATTQTAENIVFPAQEGLLPGLIEGAASLGAAAIFACWVADVLYGPAADDTKLARLYVMSVNTWFTRLYLRRGKSWAAFLTNHKWVQPLIRPIWNRMARKGRKIEHEVLSNSNLVSNPERL